MRMALSLAARGRGMTHPNPMVGALVVKGGKVVGRGYHHGPHTPHAEAEAIKEAGERGQGAELFVTLEPCNHRGRTPPCSETIIQAGIARVVIAALDPNPHVKGGGAERLRGAGIKVESGLMAGESSRLNAAYEKFVLTGKPLVTIKVAMTADGKVAARGRASRWITGEEARKVAHAMRRECDAVLVGWGTVEADDPELTVRMVTLRGARPPLRVVVDSQLSLSLDSKLAAGGEPKVVIATTARHNIEKMNALRARGVDVLVIGEREGRVDLEELLQALGEMDVAYLLVEGGPTLIASFMERGLADRVAFFVAPRVFGDTSSRSWLEGRVVNDPSEALPLVWKRIRRVGDDLLLEAEVGIGE